MGSKLSSSPSSTSAREDRLLAEVAQLSSALTARPSPSLLVERGMARFRLAQVDESISDFDAALAMDPRIEPRLWQRALSLYYVERFAEGAAQFEVDLRVNAHDAEETLWRYLCLARVHGPESPQSRAVLEDEKQISNQDPRDYMRQIYSCYLGRSTPEDLVASASPPSRASFYIRLYAGLLAEVRNDAAAARKHIVSAVADHRLQDYMWDLAWVHRKLRGWESSGDGSQSL